MLCQVEELDEAAFHDMVLESINVISEEANMGFLRANHAYLRRFLSEDE